MAASNPRQTSPKAASQAAKVLSDRSSTKAEKTAAASALAQTASKAGQTSPKAASQAAKVLSDRSSTKAEKTAAASTLVQTPTQSKTK